MNHDAVPERDANWTQDQPRIREKRGGGRVVNQNADQQPKLCSANRVAFRQPACDADRQQRRAGDAGDENRFWRGLVDPKQKHQRNRRH